MGSHGWVVLYLCTTAVYTDDMVGHSQLEDTALCEAVHAICEARHAQCAVGLYAACCVYMYMLYSSFVSYKRRKAATHAPLSWVMHRGLLGELLATGPVKAAKC